MGRKCLFMYFCENIVLVRMWLKKIHETGQGGKYKGCEILLNIYIRFRENVMKIYEMAFRKTRGGGR